MCTVSMIGDHYADKWRDKPWYPTVEPAKPLAPQFHIPAVQISREEFEALKREVEEMKALLKRAKEYDERNNEPGCEIEEKMELLRRVAKMVGVDLSDVIERASSSRF